MTATYDFAAYSVGFVFASVCTSLPDEHAAARLNAEYPTGTGSRWEVAPVKTFATGQPNPTPCERRPATHRHILFHC